MLIGSIDSKKKRIITNLESDKLRIPFCECFQRKFIKCPTNLTQSMTLISGVLHCCYDDGVLKLERRSSLHLNYKNMISEYFFFYLNLKSGNFLKSSSHFLHFSTLAALKNRSVDKSLNFRLNWI